IAARRIPGTDQTGEQHQPVGDRAKLVIHPIDRAAQLQQNAHVPSFPLSTQAPVWRFASSWAACGASRPLASLIRMRLPASMETWVRRGCNEAFRRSTLVEYRQETLRL